MDATIEKHIKVWENKPSLRLVYHEDIYKKIEGYMLHGPTLEVGAGPGFLKKYRTDIISSDILDLKHLDIVCNSLFLPFRNDSLMNITGVDVLHHFERPGLFFDECERVLKPKGRLILVEPWLSPVSRIVYTYVHHENCQTVIDPLEKPFDNGKRPWDGNSMIPYQIFSKTNIGSFNARWPNLSVLTLKPFSFFAYLMTGGFQTYGIKSERIASWLLKTESLFEPLLKHISSFRILMVLERRLGL